MSETNSTPRPADTDEELGTLIRELLETSTHLPSTSPLFTTPEKSFGVGVVAIAPEDAKDYDRTEVMVQVRAFANHLTLSAPTTPSPYTRTKFVAVVLVDRRGDVWTMSAKRGTPGNEEWMTARWNGSSDTAKISHEDLKQGLRAARKSMLEEIAVAQGKGGVEAEAPSRREEIQARMNGSVQEAFDKFDLSMPPWGSPTNSAEDRTRRATLPVQIVPLKLS